MRKLTKKIAASALALSLVFTMGTQCFASNWGSYFGGSQGWYEGAEGTLTLPFLAALTLFKLTLAGLAAPK